MNIHPAFRSLLVSALAAAALLQGCAGPALRSAHIHPLAAFDSDSTHTLVRGSNAIEVTQALGWPDKPGPELWVYPRVFTRTDSGHDDCQTLALVMIDGRVRELFVVNERGLAFLSDGLTEAKHHGVIAATAK